MSRQAVSRPQGSEPLMTTPPAHDRWLSGYLSGALELELTTPSGRAVAPGTGRLVLEGEGGSARVIEAAALYADKPVIPGSGLKGAVRNLYEILSLSCNPLESGPCQRDQRQEAFERRAYCEACSLFGSMGWQGRVSLSDAEPLEAGSVESRVVKVPVAWEPHSERTQGDFRLYDLREARFYDEKTGKSRAAPKAISRRVYSGSFKARLAFRNVSETELGRLLVCLGASPRDGEGFLFRVGGVRFDGYGAVQVRPLSVTLAWPEREKHVGDQAEETCLRWMAAAAASPWGDRFQVTLEQLSAALNAED